jgi:hypothetical protein
MDDEIKALIEKLRHETVIGGGWASIHTSDIEAIASVIQRLSQEDIVDYPVD